MSKRDKLKKIVIKDAAVMGGAAALAVAAMLGVSGLVEGAQNTRMEAENALNAARGELAALRTQIDKSGTAEKRYAEIRIARVQENYSMDTEGMKAQIKALKEKYRLTSNLKLTLSTEKKSDLPVFATLNDDVLIREDTEIIFGAMSDVHAFSFLQEFMSVIPGIVRVSKFNIGKKLGMDVNTFAQMTSGSIPEAVTVELHFLWAGLKSKEAPKTAPATPAGGV